MESIISYLKYLKVFQEIFLFFVFWMIIFSKVNDRENHKSTASKQMYTKVKLAVMA